MKKKLFIAMYTTGIVLAVVALYLAVTLITKNSVIPLTPEERIDTAIAQYGERPNSTTTILNEHLPSLISILLFPRTDPYVEGCSLRFSYAPKVKAIEPEGRIEYEITFLNKGKEKCENVSLSVYYTEKETFVSSAPMPTASDYYWAVGTLESGKTYKIMLTTQTPAGDGEEILSEACATADNSSDVCSQSYIFVKEGASQSPALSEKISISSFVSSVWGRVFNKKEFGIWIWDSPKKMNSVHAREVIEVSKRNGFNVLYVTIDDYIPISETKNKEELQRKKEEYMKTLSVFIQAAKSAGLEVDVVGGAKDWAIKENRWKGYVLIDFVKEYNAKYPNAPIRGLQYDVEPYLLPDYETDKRKVLLEFVEFIDESARRMRDMPAKFTIVIPHFYDSEQKWTPSFEYKDEHGYTFTHLLHVLRQKKDTSVIIMSYRNYFEGDNGTQQISEAEVREASEGKYDTNIIIAQETGNVPPAYVTFYDYPKVSLYDALTEINDYFDKYERFGGTAVHYFESFLKLE